MVPFYVKSTNKYQYFCMRCENGGKQRGKDHGFSSVLSLYDHHRKNCKIYEIEKEKKRILQNREKSKAMKEKESASNDKKRVKKKRTESASSNEEP